MSENAESVSDFDDTASRLGAFARTLAADVDQHRTLQAIVESAAQSVPGADSAGVSYLAHSKALAVRVQSDNTITEIDDLQTQLQSGPCMQVMTAGDNIVRVDDFGHDDRWPELAARAAERGVLSSRSMRLFIGDDTLGVLSFFAHRPNVFTEDSELLAELYATHAAVALAGVRRSHDFESALRHRDVIGQAKGYLMAVHQLDEHEAFATLVRYSQTSHTKLHQVAQELMRTVVNGSRGARQPAADS